MSTRNDGPEGFAELWMYVAPERVREAQEEWLRRVLEILDARRLDGHELDLEQLWFAPQLLLSQTCGYPLMTTLRGKVQIVGRPVYNLPNSADGNHCSLLIARADDSRQTLGDYFGAHGLVNSSTSNSGMNLFRHTLAPLYRDGTFFGQVSMTGGHLGSLAALKERHGDLAAIDSVTYDYLIREAAEEVSGLKIVGRTASGPCLPYITGVGRDHEALRLAMNQALVDMPEVSATLAISEVLPASEHDYEVLLDYEQQAKERGVEQLI